MISAFFPELAGHGGVQRTSRDCAVALSLLAKERGWDFEVHSLLGPNGSIELPGQSPLPYHGFAGNRRALMQRAFVLAPRTRALLAGHPFIAPALLPALARNRHSRFLVQTYGIDIWGDVRADRRLALRLADRTTSCSTYSAQVLSDKHGVRRDRAGTLYPCAHVLPATALDEPPFFLCVGRMQPGDREKGYEPLIRAYARAGAPACLRMVGDGAERPRLQVLADSLGIAQQVEFLGRVSDERLQQLYAGCRALILPSTKEGFGIVYTEAMAHGRVPIGVRSKAVPEVIEEDYSGLLAEPDDEKSLAEAILRVHEDDALRARLQAGARECYQRRFTFDAFRTAVNEHMEILFGGLHDVVHVVPSLDERTGGPATALLGLAKAQEKAGLRVKILAGDQIGYRRSLLNGLRREAVGPILGARMLHVHALWEGIQADALAVAQRFEIPTILRPCGMLESWPMKQGGKKKQLYLRGLLRSRWGPHLRLQYTTAEEQRLSRDADGGHASIVIPNGVDLSEFHGIEGADFRRRLSIPSNAPLVLFLARLHPKKGPDLLLRAWKNLGLEGAHLVLAGQAVSDAYESELRALAGERVHFTGHLNGPEKREALAAADLHVLPSFQENFANTVVEAAAAGTSSLVSPRVNLAPELVTSGAGWSLRVGPEAGEDFVTELTAEVRRVLLDREARDAAASAGAKFAARYAWPAIVALWRPIIARGS
jgi:glycosyltransferase involved in cell wall biosynthesis